MKYELDIEINRPRDAVLTLFFDPERQQEWQPELVRFDHVSGPKPRGLGTVSRLLVKMGRREMEMTETITVHDPPERSSAIYEAKGVWNEIENTFSAPTPDRTHWHLTSEFRCDGLLMRMMTWLAPGMFRKQTKIFMERFKAFCETTIPDGG
ncbi:MAG: SRPBCC family protein [Pseudomonadota bacterium]